MSIVFDEVEGRFFGAAASEVWVRARALGTLAGMRGRVGRRGGQGRAVRPGRRGSLDGPGRKLSPATMGMEPRQGFLVASLWVDTAVTSPLAPRAGRGRPWGSAAGHSFVPTVRGAWCVPATARRAALSSSASPVVNTAAATSRHPGSPSTQAPPATVPECGARPDDDGQAQIAGSACVLCPPGVPCGHERTIRVLSI